MVHSIDTETPSTSLATYVKEKGKKGPNNNSCKNKYRVHY